MIHYGQICILAELCYINVCKLTHYVYGLTCMWVDMSHYQLKHRYVHLLSPLLPLLLMLCCRKTFFTHTALGKKLATHFIRLAIFRLMCFRGTWNAEPHLACCLFVRIK